MWRKRKPEKKTTVGPLGPFFKNRSPGSNPRRHKKDLLASRPGTGEVFKEGGGRREKKCQAVYPPVFQFSFPSVGRRLPVAEGLALAWEEIACMSWKIPVLGAQDKDIRPDTEESC